MRATKSKKVFCLNSSGTSWKLGVVARIYHILVVGGTSANRRRAESGATFTSTKSSYCTTIVDAQLNVLRLDPCKGQQQIERGAN